METHSRILAWRNPIDRGVWWATVHAGAKEWDTTEHAHIPPVDKRCAAAAAKSLQSCPTLSDPMDRSLPGSSIHGILQARVLEWVALPSPVHKVYLLINVSHVCVFRFRVYSRT